MELDAASGSFGSLKKSYYYANSQVLAQWDHTDPDGDGVYDDLYFYLHDRLGSVRQVIDESAQVMHYYIYDPFGQMLETGSAPDIAPTNAFLYTGQWYDEEIGQYYLRARMYDPALMRFTARDPVTGYYTEPLTLHRYFYCANDPMNRIDLDGEFFMLMDVLLGSSMATSFAGDWESSKDYGGVLQSARGLCGMVNTRNNMISMVAGVQLGSLDTSALDGAITMYDAYQTAQMAYLGAGIMKAGASFATEGIVGLIQRSGRNNRHHVWPKFLGGPKGMSQDLLYGLDSSVHRQFHNQLWDDLYSGLNKEFKSADLPESARYWSQKQWKEWYDAGLELGEKRHYKALDILWNTTAKFDDAYGTSMLPKLTDVFMKHL